MHGDVVTIGPLMWFLLGLGVASLLLAVYVVADSLRRPGLDFAGVPETRWTYAAFGAVYAVAFVAFQFPALSGRFAWLGTLVIIGLPLMFGVGAAYLLRVVFPKRPRPDAASREPGEGDDGESVVPHTTEETTG